MVDGAPGARRRRANGDESRRRVIEAATEIAGERGYDGTSISLVRQRSGVPTSSIYWHFKDKDALIAEVIQHSFERWRELMRPAAPDDVRDAGGRRAAIAGAMRRAGTAIAAAPDFIRLGLLLTLERRPQEPAARSRFLGVRAHTRADTERFYGRLYGDALAPDDARLLAVLAMAAADGLFVAREVEGDALDVDRAFELVGVALAAVADHLADAAAGPSGVDPVA